MIKTISIHQVVRRVIKPFYNNLKGGIIYDTLPVIMLACFHSTVLMIMITQATHTTAS